MIEYGTKLVGAAKPGKGGTTQDGIPLFDTVAQAVDATGANSSIIFVPAAGAPDARETATGPAPARMLTVSSVRTIAATCRD